MSLQSEFLAPRFESKQIHWDLGRNPTIAWRLREADGGPLSYGKSLYKDSRHVLHRCPHAHMHRGPHSFVFNLLTPTILCLHFSHKSMNILCVLFFSFFLCSFSRIFVCIVMVKVMCLPYLILVTSIGFLTFLVPKVFHPSRFRPQISNCLILLPNVSNLCSIGSYASRRPPSLLN